MFDSVFLTLKRFSSTCMYVNPKLQHKNVHYMSLHQAGMQPYPFERWSHVKRNIHVNAVQAIDR